MPVKAKLGYAARGGKKTTALPPAITRPPGDIMGYVAPSAPLSIGGLLDDWLRLFRVSFRQCWAVAAVAVVVVGVVIFLVKPVPPPPALPLWQQRLQLWGMLNGPQGALAPLVTILINLAVSGALFAVQTAVFRGQPLTYAGALGIGLRRLPQMLLGFVLWLLAMTVACVVVALPVGIVAFIAIVTVRLTIHSLSLFAAHAIGLGTALILGAAALIGSFYVFVRLDLWQPAIFADGDNALTSIARSWRLVKGHWWRTTVILFVAGVLIYVLGYLAPWLVGLACGAFTPHTMHSPEATLTLRLLQVFSQMTHVITLPLTTSVLLSIYSDLKLRREGTDLAARAEALSVA